MPADGFDVCLPTLRAGARKLPADADRVRATGSAAARTASAAAAGVGPVPWWARCTQPWGGCGGDGGDGVVVERLRVDPGGQRRPIPGRWRRRRPGAGLDLPRGRGVVSQGDPSALETLADDWAGLTG